MWFVVSALSRRLEWSTQRKTVHHIIIIIITTCMSWESGRLHVNHVCIMILARNNFGDDRHGLAGRLICEARVAPKVRFLVEGGVGSLAGG